VGVLLAADGAVHSGGNMESKAKLFGHPIHQMLIPFPLGLLSTAAIFDVIYLITDNSVWVTTSFFLILAGVIGGLAAAVFGAVDFFAIPNGTRARRIGRVHGIGNVVLVTLFAGSWWLRLVNREDPGILAIALSLIGAGLGLITGWLGGELVDRLGVGVDDGANLNAPSSLSGPASPRAAGGRLT
jgi:uncharacterized membrane protein